MGDGALYGHPAPLPNLRSSDFGRGLDNDGRVTPSGPQTRKKPMASHPISRNKRLRTHAGAVLLALGLTAAGAAQAASLSITNASFELPSLANGGFTGAVPPGWQAFQASLSVTSGVFNPTDSQLPTVPDGLQVGFINPSASGPGIQQTLSDTLEGGGHYLLQADFAYRKDCCSKPAFALELLAGDTVLATFIGTQNDFDNVSFKTAALSFETPLGSALIGQALGIRISAGPGLSLAQIAFDNVRLTENISAIPLPLPAVLMGSALVGLMAVRRRTV